jgi:class 3 adenylate cyclase/tetratricopeptide (TPR) repeat protein
MPRVNCSACGHVNPARARFCLECGTPFQVTCAQCRTELPAGARFCLECGAAVAAGNAASGAPPAAGPTLPERTPADYTPKHLADKIFQSRSALEGERKQVTVLFADVKGSMELAEKLDPETWHGILDGLFHILADGVHRFEGTVNQYTGDGIMALFGAPIAHEDHAQRACYAALHLVDAVRQHALEVRRRHGLDLAFRLGLNSGEVVVGRIGDDLRMDYTAAGHSVGLAQRMEALAEAGACYLTDATAQLVAGYFTLEDLGEFDVKGVGEAVRVHKLLGMGSARTRFDVSRNRGLTHFVGRAPDLQTLEQALDRARSGQGAVLAVIAEAGTGKSRLCFEFAEACRGAGYPVTEGHAVAHGKSIPLIPVLEVFRDYFGIGDRDDPRAAREKIAGRLLLLDSDFRDVLPVLFDFLGVADPEDPAPRLDPEARQRRLFGVVRALLKRSTAERPGILMIEDLHWLDGSSEVWVRNWVDAVAGTHNLLLLNSRPEYHADWMQRSHYQQLALAPLGADAIRELSRALLGSDPTTAGLSDAIYQRTRGNPFFAEEVVRSLIESGHLVGAPGAYKLAGPVDELRVPDSVQALLAARIDRLVDRAKRLLQIAAVIGKQFREPVLARVAGITTQQLGEALAQLRDAEFVYEESLYPVAEYAFKHPLTQEVALASQLQDTRRRAHAAVAKATEEFDADRLDEQAATLAHHWEQAGEHGLAATWHARAARWSMRTDTEEAYRHWVRVRELAQDGGGENADLLGDAYVALVNLGWRSGRSPAETRTTFEAGRRLFDANGDRRALTLLLSNYSLVGGVHSEQRIEHHREAVRLAHATGDLSLQINVTIFTFPCLYGGLIREAHENANAAIALIEANGWTGPSLVSFDTHRWIYSARSWTHCLLGDIESALADSERGLELARQGDAADLLYAEHLRWRLDSWRGEPEAGLQHARRQYELGEQVGGRSNSVLGTYGLGIALCEVGRWAEALPLLEEGYARTLEVETYSPYAGLAATLLHCGNEKRALDIARESVAYCERFGIVFSEFEMQLELAAVATALGELEEARRAVARARELAERMECRVLAPRVVEAEAELAGASGDTGEQRRLLAAARESFAGMGAAGHARRLGAMLDA